MHRWRVVLAILVGSLLGNGLMLAFSKQISQYVSNDSWWLRIGGVVAMVVALFFVERQFRRLKNEYLAQEALNLKIAHEGSEPDKLETTHNDADEATVVADSHDSGNQ